MKPTRRHPPLQQLNLTLDATPASLSGAPQTELESALAELFLSVARACLNPQPGDSDESDECKDNR
jgi:hypothetical protein